MEKLDTVGTVRQAFELGINAVDTSPFYTTSEAALGEAFEALAKDFPRETYILSTKCGRYGTKAKDFDFSGPRIRKSIQESLEKLRTTYLDIVYCHDVEFVSDEQVTGPNCALDELFKMKSEGLIRKVGISGYPLETILRIAKTSQAQGRPLDIIMTYSNYCFHCTLLREYEPKLRQAGVQYIVNASPLSMGLLRKQGPQIWHPAPRGLRDAVQKCVDICNVSELDFARMALEFAIDYDNVESLAVGFSNPEEVKETIEVLNGVDKHKHGDVPPERQKWLDAKAKCETVIKEWRSYTWKSPPDPKPRQKDNAS